MLQRGERVGDWVIERSLGQGGMGAVYLARNALTDRIRAAVKVVMPLALSAERERFVREVEALDALRHPAIVGVKGWGEDVERGVLWIAMDFVQGEELGHRIGRGPIPPGEAARWFASLADGLSYAHARGFRHRDIKPANILIDASGDAHLVDFGIAVADGRTRVTAEGRMPGTPAYMAPEAFDVRDPDPVRMDVYALGLVLHEALTGAPAFQASAELPLQQQLVRLIHQKVQAPALDPGPAFPEALRALVRAATEPDPERRLPGAADLRDGLLPFATDDVGRPHPATLPGAPLRAAATRGGTTRAEDTFTLTLPKPTGRRGLVRWAAALGALGALAGGGALAWATWTAPPEHRDAVVLVGGLPPDVPVAVTVNGAPGARQGMEFWFPQTLAGPMKVAAAAGAQCDFLQFDGESCPPCCSCAFAEYVLERGFEPDLTPLTLAPPEPVAAREVIVLAQELPPGAEARFSLSTAGEPTERAPDRTRWASVPLGAAELVAELGPCDAAARGCSDRGDCPPGCASSVYPIGITCDAGPARIHVPMEAP